MTIPNKKDQNDPPQKEIKFILELFNSKKLNEAKKEINRKITKYVNSPILFNILGAILGEQNQLNDSIANKQWGWEAQYNFKKSFSDYLFSKL